MQAVLLADIGGTHARFGLGNAQGLDLTSVRQYACAAFPTPLAAIQAYSEQLHHERGGQDPVPGAAVLAVATALQGDHVQFTNSHWSFSQQQLQAAAGWQHLSVINDFAALAASIPVLPQDALMPIGPVSLGPLVSHCAVLGPGTGLGVAGLVRTPDGHWVPVAGEGGHVSFSPGDPFEADILRWCWQTFDHVSIERLVSGIGLPYLYRAVCAVMGLPQALAEPTPKSIFEAADAGDVACGQVRHSFAAMLGSIAGNVALTFGAHAGVFLAGGITQHMRAFLPHSAFRERFEAKGRFRPLLEQVPTAVIDHPHAALVGTFATWQSQLAPMVEHGG